LKRSFKTKLPRYNNDGRRRRRMSIRLAGEWAS